MKVDLIKWIKCPGCKQQLPKGTITWACAAVHK